MPVRFTRRQILVNSIRLSAVALVGKGWWNTGDERLRLEQSEVRIPRLPKEFDGVKIGLLSDLHASATVSESLIEQAATRLMEQKPDIIALCGDFISGSTRFGNSGSVGEFKSHRLEQCVAAISSLSAPMGIYGVLGNHDFWSGQEAVAAIMEQFSNQLGVRWLRNSGTQIDKGDASINILGVDDYWEATCSLGRALRDCDEKSVRILLSHNPDINEAIETDMERIDLVLSGHTHGGQIALPFIGAPYLPSKYGQRYRQGLVRDGERQTYITRGVGHLLLPLRLNCPPEASILTLRSGDVQEA